VPPFEAHLPWFIFATKCLLGKFMASFRICPVGVIPPFEAHLSGVMFTTKSLLVGIVASLGIHLTGVMLPVVVYDNDLEYGWS
jgi:hypothetical protein